MSDPTITPVNLEQMEEDEKREKIRNRVLLGLILLILLCLSAWVGSIVTANQNEKVKAEEQTEQAQVEKFNLAQQVAEACADQAATSLDEATYTRLCTDARTIVREGPQGAQGIPGVQGPAGIQGIQGIQGFEGPKGDKGDTGATGLTGEKGDKGDTGAQGAPGEKGEKGDTGAQGVQGEKGETGSVGPQGVAGVDGQPPFSWVVFNEGGQIVESCVRADPFDAKAPTYTCTRS
jgi:Na+-transporting methylmalonyl-CoA/oxaloacetate decarboxylase gamma subunit